MLRIAYYTHPFPFLPCAPARPPLRTRPARQETCKVLRATFMASGPSSPGMDLDQGLELVREYRAKLAEVNHAKEALVNAQKLFGIDVTRYPELQDVAEELANVTLLYEVYSEQKVRRVCGASFVVFLFDTHAFKEPTHGLGNTHTHNPTCSMYTRQPHSLCSVLGVFCWWLFFWLSVRVGRGGGVCSCTASTPTRGRLPRVYSLCAATSSPRCAHTHTRLRASRMRGNLRPHPACAQPLCPPSPQAFAEMNSNMLWADLDISALEAGSEDLVVKVRKMPKALKDMSTYHAVAAVVNGFREGIPLIASLKNEAMKVRGGVCGGAVLCPPPLG
jgi:hypothetical protein